MSPPPLYAVVLAGGVGRRFWPASRPDRPKQLLPLGEDGEPLVVDAVRRAEELAGRERVRLLAGRRMMPRLLEVLPELGAEHLLQEPEPRGTGPALTWAAQHVAARDPDAVMLSLHADHRIGPASAFRETARRTAAAAERHSRLFCIGASPDRPETGYGYVRLGGELSDGVFEVDEFVEKPSLERAKRYLDRGGYLWNTGIFGWKARDFLEVVRSHTPELREALPLLEVGDVEGYFRSVTPVSVDVGVMERAPRVGVVEAAFRWDDLGVWPSLARNLPSDHGGNTTVGPVRCVEARDNVAWSEDGRIVLFGVEGLVVARSGGQTLVTTRENAPRLKALLEALEAAEGEAASDADPEEGPI